MINIIPYQNIKNAEKFEKQGEPIVYEGRTYHVMTCSQKLDPLHRLVLLIGALALTIITLGVGLYFERLRNQWKDVYFNNCTETFHVDAATLPKVQEKETLSQTLPQPPIPPKRPDPITPILLSKVKEAITAIETRKTDVSQPLQKTVKESPKNKDLSETEKLKAFWVELSKKHKKEERLLLLEQNIPKFSAHFQHQIIRRGIIGLTGLVQDPVISKIVTTLNLLKLDPLKQIQLLKKLSLIQNTKLVDMLPQTLIQIGIELEKCQNMKTKKDQFYEYLKGESLNFIISSDLEVFIQGSHFANGSFKEVSEVITLNSSDEFVWMCITDEKVQSATVELKKQKEKSEVEELVNSETTLADAKKENNLDKDIDSDSTPFDDALKEKNTLIQLHKEGIHDQIAPLYKVAIEVEKGENPKRLIIIQKRFNRVEKLLESIVSQPQLQNMKDILTIGKCIAKALKEMHDKGFIFLDLKPDNILYEEENSRITNARLTDFGTTSRSVGDVFYGGTAPYLPAEIVKFRNPSQELDPKVVEAELNSNRSYLEEENNPSLKTLSKQQAINKIAGSKYRLTGKPHSNIDSFSLGITLIELITGECALIKTLADNSTKMVIEYFRMSQFQLDRHLSKHIPKMINDHKFLLPDEKKLALSILKVCVDLIKYKPEDRISCKDAYERLCQLG